MKISHSSGLSHRPVTILASGLLHLPSCLGDEVSVISAANSQKASEDHIVPLSGPSWPQHRLCRNAFLVSLREVAFPFLQPQYPSFKQWLPLGNILRRVDSRPPSSEILWLTSPPNHPVTTPQATVVKVSRLSNVFPSGQHPVPNCQETPRSLHLCPGCRHLALGSNLTLSPGPAPPLLLAPLLDRGSHRATCPALPTARPRPAPRAERLGRSGGRAARVSARPRRRRDPSSGARAGRAQLAGAPPRGRGCGRYKRAAVAARPARSPERDGQPPRRGKMLDGSLLARWLAAAFGLTLLLAALRPSAAYFG